MEAITIADAFRIKERDPTIKSIEFGPKIDLWDAMDPLGSELFTIPKPKPVVIVTFKHDNGENKWTTSYQIGGSGNGN